MAILYTKKHIQLQSINILLDYYQDYYCIILYMIICTYQLPFLTVTVFAFCKFAPPYMKIYLSHITSPFRVFRCTGLAALLAWTQKEHSREQNLWNRTLCTWKVIESLSQQQPCFLNQCAAGILIESLLMGK